MSPSSLFASVSSLSLSFLLFGCSCQTAVVPDAGGDDAPIGEDSGTDSGVDAPALDAGTDAGADTGADAPLDASDFDADLHLCSSMSGPVTACGALEYCNISCRAANAGTCEPAGMDCGTGFSVCGCDGVTYPSECEAQLAGTDILFVGDCEDTGPCAPDVAWGERDCDLVLGFYWSGTRCEHLTGCVCRGPDCDTSVMPARAPYADEAACLDAHTACTFDTFACDPGLDCITGVQSCSRLTGPGGSFSLCQDLPIGTCSVEATCEACLPLYPDGTTCTELSSGALELTIP